MFDVKEAALIKAAFAEYHSILAEALPGEELKDVDISPQLENRIARLLWHQKHFYYAWINTTAKRVACIIAAFLLAAALMTASVEGLREAFINFVIETFEKGSTIFFHQEEADHAEVTPVVPKIPSYLPEGYRLVADMSNELEVNLIFEKGENTSINFFQSPKGSKQTVNTEGVGYEKVWVLDIYEGIYFENKGNAFLIFNDSEYEYSIIGTISEEEAFKIAESIPFEMK